jgi:hypothetical protein
MNTFTCGDQVSHKEESDPLPYMEYNVINPNVSARVTRFFYVSHVKI